MRTKVLLQLCMLLIPSIGLIFGSLILLAQEEIGSTVVEPEIADLIESADSEGGVEEVVVTGSRLKRSTLTSISPLEIVNTEISREGGLLNTEEIPGTSTSANSQQVDLTFSESAFDDGPGSHSSSDLNFDDYFGEILFVAIISVLAWAIGANFIVGRDTTIENLEFESITSNLGINPDVRDSISKSSFKYAQNRRVTPMRLSDSWLALFTKSSLFSPREASFKRISFRREELHGRTYSGDAPCIFNCVSNVSGGSTVFWDRTQRVTVFCFENKNTPCRYNLSKRKGTRDDSFFRNKSTTIQEIKYSVSGPETFDSGVKSLKSYTKDEPFNEKFEQNSDDLETFQNFLTDKKIKLLMKLDNTTVIEATPKVTLFYDWPKIVDITELKDKHSYFEDIHKILDCS